MKIKQKLFLALLITFAFFVFGGTEASADSSSNSINTSNLYVNQLVSTNSGLTDVASQEAPVPLEASLETQSQKVRVVKLFYFDRGPFGDTNFHGYQYIYIPKSSRKTGYTNQKVGSGWNYVRFQHINYFSGGY